jgi:hypothetical protein
MARKTTKDEIRLKNERIAELREEIDEQRDLIQRLREHAEEYVIVIESWKEAFGMTITDNGAWTWEPYWKERQELIDQYNALVRDWNKYLPLLRQQPVGRPLAASEAQCVTVLKLRKAGRSLREIAEETSLGLNTVRTIIDKADRKDRTTRKHWQRIEPDRQRVITWKRQHRAGQGLPKRAQKAVEDGQALIREAKGLGRA